MIPVFFRSMFICCLLFLVTTITATGTDAADMPGAEKVFTGNILETMNAAGYTYVNLETESGPLWLALPESEVKAGDRISVIPGMEMKDFHSNALDKTFPKIFFSPGIVGSPELNPHKTAETSKNETGNDPFAAAIAAERQGGEGQQIQPNQSSGGSMGAVVPFKETKVEKVDGENGYTVEEIFAKAKELDGKTVRVRVQIVKYNANIMGRNWLHVQDGSGDPMENTHDLVVTTKEEVQSPDIVIIEGKLTAEKDFGAGYKYAVIIEDGTIIK
jgi:hypothetical protein